MISAKVVADSKNEFGDRLTTMVVTFPRFILAEFNTHRMFSRNSASSRAIPFEKMIKSVEENPFIPIAWQKDHKGMQGTEYITDENLIKRNISIWKANLTETIYRAKILNSECEVTKQLCNRLLEPFMWHTVIVTATEWENFFSLRCPKYESKHGNFRSKKDVIKRDQELNHRSGQSYNNLSDLEWLSINTGQAEIHMMALAEAMWDAYNESNPKQLKAGEWHIPFGDNIDLAKLNYDLLLEKIDKPDELLVKIATARCARVSYTVVGEEGKSDNYENDIKLHDRLLASGHFSPFEHCAQSMSHYEYYDYCGEGFYCGQMHGWSGNLRGFKQYRKMLEK